MILKKAAIGIMVSFCMMTTAFGGTEDWNGTFTVVNGKGSVVTVTHTPTSVSMMGMTAGTCLQVNNIKLCTKSKVEEFSNELLKLGMVINKSVSLGPTYYSN